MSARIELGGHDATIVSVDLIDRGGKEGKEANQAIQITLSFDGCADENGAPQLSYFGGFSDAAMSWTGDVLEACGWNPEEHGWNIVEIDKGKDSPLVGTKVNAWVVEDEWPEGSGTYVKKVKNIQSGERKTSDEKRSALVDRIKGFKRDPNRPRGGQAAAKPVASSGDYLDADDTPF